MSVVRGSNVSGFKTVHITTLVSKTISEIAESDTRKYFSSDTKLCPLTTCLKYGHHIVRIKNKSAIILISETNLPEEDCQPLTRTDGHAPRISLQMRPNNVE